MERAVFTFLTVFSGFLMPTMRLITFGNVRHYLCFFGKIIFSIFRSRKKFSTTYAIVLFFLLFFFSRPFHENFKILKNCPYDFHEILHRHSTPKGAPACAKASKSYGWVSGGIPKNCSEGWVGPLSRDRGRS